MSMRQIGSFNSPTVNPLASRITTGTNVVQTQGIFQPSDQGQALSGGQWATDPYANETILLLQTDNAANAIFNGTVVDSSPNNFTITTVSQNTAQWKLNQTAMNPFGNGGANQSFLNTSYITFSSVGINLAAGNAYCVEGWMYLYAYPTTTTTYKFLLSNCDQSTGLAWGVGVTNLGKPAIVWNDGAAKQLTGSLNVPLNQWVFLQFQVLPSDIVIRVNGQRDAAVTGDTYSTPTPLYTYTAGSDRNTAANFDIFNLRVSDGIVLGSDSTPMTPPTEVMPLLSTPSSTATTVLSTFYNGILADFSTSNVTLTQSATLPYASPFIPFSPKYSMRSTGSYFFSSGSSITVPDNANLDVGAVDFTIELFVFPYTTLTGGLIGKRSTTAVFQGANITASSNSIIATASVNGTTYGVTITSAANVIKVHQWNHVAFSRSGNVWTLYVNGASTGTPVTLAGTVADNTSGMTIGSSSVANSDYISRCLISNIRLIKGAGSSIAYSTRASIPTAPLTPVPNTQLLLLAATNGVGSASPQMPITALGTGFPTVNTSFFLYGSGSLGITSSSAFTALPSAQIETGQMWSSDFTVEGWVYLNNLPSIAAAAYGLVGIGPSTSVGWRLIISTTNTLTFNHTATAVNAPGALINTTRQWYHFAVCRSGVGANNLLFFINGRQVGRNTTAINTIFDSTTSGTTGMFIGADQANGSIMNGYLEDVRVTKGFARYKRGFNPPPIGYTRQ